MKIKGFTLIELLAVIVILAIIALIATPIILNIIDSSKESAHKRSLELYKSAVEQAVTRHNLNNKTPLSNGDYMPNNDGTLLTLDDANNFKVSYSGNVVKCNVNLNEGDITLSECTIDGSVVKNDVIVDVNQGDQDEESNDDLVLVNPDPSKRDILGYARYTTLLNDTIQTIKVNGETYTAHVYNFDGDQVWSENKIFGSASDVGTIYEDAKNMVIVKVNGNLTINEGVTITTYGTEYGGPKGFYLCVTGTLINNGTITMTARGAKAEGQDVYLYQNSDGSYEYVPALGEMGGAGVPGNDNVGNDGFSGVNRTTGGGGSGAHHGNGAKYSGSGGNGTSYSGGSGGGGAYHVSSSGTPTYNGGTGNSYGGLGGGGAVRSWGYYTYASGGAGNPAGNGAFSKSDPGNVYGNDITHAENGTGGLLILYTNNLDNKGVISSNGSNVNGLSVNNVSRYAGGGASGGGSINIFTNTLTTYGTIQANGGISSLDTTGITYGIRGSNGGNGSVTVDILDESENKNLTYTTQENNKEYFIYEHDSKSNTNQKLVDLTNNGKDGIINGAIFTDYGLYFDGVDDYALLNEFNYNEFTLEVSFIINGFTENYPYIIGNYDSGGCAIRLGTEKAPYLYSTCYVNGEEKTIKYNGVETNKLYTTSLTYKDNLISFYVNGSLAGQIETTQSIDLPAESARLMLGAAPLNNEPNKTYGLFNGYIMSARGYNYVLTQSEINNDYLYDKNKYNKNINKPTEGKLVEYDMTNEENTSTELIDLTGNINGTIKGATQSEDGLYFNGSSYVLVDEINNPYLSYTATFRTESNGYQQIINNIENGGCSLCIDGESVQGKCYLGSSYVSATYDKLTMNTIYTATITYDGYYVKLYLNGNLVAKNGSEADFDYIPDDKTAVMIGYNPEGNSPQENPYYGSIYYSNIYNRPLSDMEIRLLHNDLQEKYGIPTSTPETTALIVNFDSSNASNTPTLLKNKSLFRKNGTISGATLTSDGLYFDGIDDYVKIWNMNYQKFTYLMTLKVSSELSAYAAILNNYDSGGCGIEYYETKQICGKCYIGNAYYGPCSETIELDKEYKVALTYDGRKLELYLDGVSQGVHETTTISYSNVQMILGGNSYGSSANTNFFKGHIKNVKIYNRALTADEILKY